MTQTWVCPLTLSPSDMGLAYPCFRKNGNWARYSNLLVPKSHQQHTQPFFNSTNYIRPKRRVPRPKSGQNTAHKGHGMTKGDILKGLGKSIPCEVSCSKKINNPFSHIQKPLITSTLHWPSSISTSINISTNKNTSNMPLMVSYPSKRTKWERSPGGSLRGGGPTTPITIRLMGSIPKNYEGDHRKLTITCQDSVVECSLFVIEFHSEYTKNMLHECGNCRWILNNLCNNTGIHSNWNFPQFRASVSNETCGYSPRLYCTNSLFSLGSTADWNHYCEQPDRETKDSRATKTTGLWILDGSFFFQYFVWTKN